MQLRWHTNMKQFVEREELSIASHTIEEFLPSTITSIATFLSSQHIGFRLRYNERSDNFHVASTARILSMLDEMYPGRAIESVSLNQKGLVDKFNSIPWQSEGGSPDDPHPTTLILECAARLRLPISKRKLERGTNLLISNLRKNIGGTMVSVIGAPPHAYANYWVCLALSKNDDIDKDILRRAVVWAWDDFLRHLAYYHCKDEINFDANQLAFDMLCLVRFGHLINRRLSHELTTAAIEALATSQLTTGTWPIGYPFICKKGGGYVHVCSIDTALALTSVALNSELECEFLPLILRCIKWVRSSVIERPVKRCFWKSDRLHSIGEPESWLTTVVYHFLFQTRKVIP